MKYKACVNCDHAKVHNCKIPNCGLLICSVDVPFWVTENTQAKYDNIVAYVGGENCPCWKERKKESE